MTRELTGINPSGLHGIELPGASSSLLNVFRLLLPMLLLLVFFFDAPDQQRRQRTSPACSSASRRLLRVRPGLHPDHPAPLPSAEWQAHDPARRRRASRWRC